MKESSKYSYVFAEEIPGTGIGLSVCGCVIERYGGNIRADPERVMVSLFSSPWRTPDSTAQPPKEN
jgi:hypothetical protein